MVSSHKDLISLLDYSADEICGVLDIAADLKKRRLTSDPQVFKGRSGVMIFEKPSLRTRITFETALHELGGHALNLDAKMVRIGERETVEDVARNLQRWVHCIIARTFAHQTVVGLAQAASIPVINALTDLFHPCQALAFALTAQERLGKLRGATVIFIGDGNNVSASLMVLCAKQGANFTLACPQGYEPGKELVDQCRALSRESGARLTISHDIYSSLKDASIIYTDVWTSMGQETESVQRRKDFSSFQVNRDLLSHAPADVLVSHCLPAHRGQEITSDVLDSDRSMAFDEAENRLHVQKAVIVHLSS